MVFKSYLQGVYTQFFRSFVDDLLHAEGQREVTDAPHAATVKGVGTHSVILESYRSSCAP